MDLAPPRLVEKYSRYFLGRRGQFQVENIVFRCRDVCKRGNYRIRPLVNTWAEGTEWREDGTVFLLEAINPRNTVTYGCSMLGIGQQTRCSLGFFGLKCPATTVRFVFDPFSCEDVCAPMEYGD